MRSSLLLALAASLSATQAVFQGFNYGAAKSDQSPMLESDFQSKFAAAKALAGTNGAFSSARLYTMIQSGSTTNEPIQAIPAAITEQTSLLLGLWASAGQSHIDDEIRALNATIDKYKATSSPTQFTDLIAGISVGSEDLYRISDIARTQNHVTDAGADPATIVDYIKQVRAALKAKGVTALVGHVDTWTAWADPTNAEVIANCDWIGVDAYPYFQSGMSNAISSGKSLFDDAISQVKAQAGSKEIWVTESGWPVSGPTSNLAIPSPDNAKTYWDQVGCPDFGSVNTWWYTLQDSDNGVTPSPSFGVIGSDGKPVFDLSCSNITTSSSSSSASATSSGFSTATSGSSATATGSSATDVGELTPSKAGGGAGIIATSAGAATSTGTSSGSGSSGSGSSGSGSSSGGSSSNGTVTTGTPKPTTSTTPATGAASALTGSFVGLVVAALIAIVAL